MYSLIPYIPTVKERGLCIIKMAVLLPREQQNIPKYKLKRVFLLITMYHGSCLDLRTIKGKTKLAPAHPCLSCYHLAHLKQT